MKSPIISLLTDFGLEDNFVGVMKGVILGINPNVQIIDICHNVEPQNIQGAAFLLRSSYPYFPSGTIHLVVVDPGVGSQRQAIIVKTRQFIFIGPDNGVLSLALAKEGVERVIRITDERFFLKPLSGTFHGRDIFAPCAAHLSLGEALENFGPVVGGFKVLNLPRVEVQGKRLLGEVIYIDRFGNLITNIDEPLFRRFAKGRYKVSIGKVEMARVSQSYVEARAGEPLAIFNSLGSLEIAVNCGSAKEYFKAHAGLAVEVISE